MLKIQTGQRDLLQTQLRDKTTEDSDVLPQQFYFYLVEIKITHYFYTPYIFNIILINYFLQQRFPPKHETVYVGNVSINST